jgi:hypothetical protein
MTDDERRTEDWRTLPWKQYQRNVYRLQKRIYQAARQAILKTIAHLLKSRMTRKCHVRFGSGSGVGDRPADHNWAAPQVILLTIATIADYQHFDMILSRWDGSQ